MQGHRVTGGHVFRRGFVADPRVTNLSIRILRVRPEHIEGDLPVNGDRLNAMDDGGACAFEHVGACGAEPRMIASGDSMVTRSGDRWTRRVRALAGLLALASIWAVTTSAREQDLPPAADLVAKHVAAIGGADAIRAVMSFRATGRTEAPGQNMRGTFEILGARPAKSVMRMDIDGLGRAESGFNGALGWSLDPMVGPSILTGRMLEELKGDSHIDAALYPPDLVKSMTTTARVTFDGRSAFKVHVVLVSGRPRDDYFDVATGYLIGPEGDTETPMGTLPMTMMLRNYKALRPQKHPPLMVQVAMGAEQHFSVETYEYNVVKPEAFDPPAIIRAIIRSEPEPTWRPAAIASFDEVWTTINESFYYPPVGAPD